MKRKLEKIFKNELAREIVMFFYNNPGSVDTVSGISAWVGERKEKVKEVLDFLVKESVLDIDSTSTTNAYCLTGDKNVVRFIKQFLKNEK